MGADSNTGNDNKGQKLPALPKRYKDLFEDETKAIAFLGTQMADGVPQVTPVWFNWDGQHILINSARGRTKDRNMRARPIVTLAISDPKDPYRYVQVRGRVVEMKETGADEHISTLSYKYHGKPYEINPGDVRVIYKILPEKFISQ